MTTTTSTRIYLRRATLDPFKDGAPANDPDELAATLGDWLDVLTDEFGLEPHQFADCRANQVRTAQLQRYLIRWQKATTLNPDQAAKLLITAGDFSEVSAIISTAVRAANPDERAAGIDIVNRAIAENQRRLRWLINAHADAIMTQLKDMYAASVTTTLEVVDQLPANVRKLEEAARARVAPQWLTLEAEKDRRARILDLVCGLYRWRILPNENRRPLEQIMPSELVYANPQKAADLNTVRTKTTTLDQLGVFQFDALVLREAGARLGTTSEARGPIVLEDTPERIRAVTHELTGHSLGRAPGESSH